MVRVSRELIYSNGKIFVANSYDKIEFIVCKEDKIVESRSYPLNMWDNKDVIDNLISTMKGKHTLLHIEDDCTRVLSNSKKRYVIRGTGSCIHVLCSNDGSNYIKQVFLVYDYSELSMNDYACMFGM